MKNSDISQNSPKGLTLLAVFFFAIVIIIFFSFALLIFISGLGTLSPAEPLSGKALLLLTGGIITLGVFQIPGLYLNIRKLVDGSGEPIKLLEIKDRYFFPIIVLGWLLVLVLGHIFQDNFFFGILLLPILNILALGAPILLIIRLAIRGLEVPSFRMVWSIFGIAIIIPPFFAFVFEAMAAGAIFLILYIFANSLPGLQNAFSNLVNSIQINKNLNEVTSKLVADLLFAPGAAISTFGLFSLAVPAIEELSKIIILLPFLKRMRNNTDGFILGVICGAAFAFAENVGFSSVSANSWAAGVSTRAVAAILHISLSGILGFGLVSAWRERKFSPFIGSFMAAIMIHGLWNGITLGLVMNNFVDFAVNAPLLYRFAFPFLAAQIILAVGLFLGLILFNHRLRTSS